MIFALIMTLNYEIFIYFNQYGSIFKLRGITAHLKLNRIISIVLSKIKVINKSAYKLLNNL